jgi:hypothetical protein
VNFLQQPAQLVAGRGLFPLQFVLERRQLFDSLQHSLIARETASDITIGEDGIAKKQDGDARPSHRGRPEPERCVKFHSKLQCGGEIIFPGPAVHPEAPFPPHGSGRRSLLPPNLRHAAHFESWEESARGDPVAQDEGAPAAAEALIAVARDEPAPEPAAREALLVAMSGSRASANYLPGCDARCHRGL